MKDENFDSNLAAMAEVIKHRVKTVGAPAIIQENYQTSEVELSIDGATVSLSGRQAHDLANKLHQAANHLRKKG